MLFSVGAFVCGAPKLQAPFSASIILFRWLAVAFSLVASIWLMAACFEHINLTISSFYSKNFEVYKVRAEHVNFVTNRWTSRVFGVNVSDYFFQAISRIEENPLENVGQVGKFAQNTLGSIFLLVLFTLFLLPVAVNATRGALLQKIDASIQNYIVSKAIISLLVAFSVYLVFVFIGFPIPFVFAFFTFFLNFIPNVGAMIAVFVLPLPCILLDPHLHTDQRILALVVPFLVHGLIGNCVEPAWFGDSLALHPATILLSLAFWTALWGLPGGVLSVPLTAVFKITLMHVEHPYTVALGRCLGGKLSPAESDDDNRDPSAELSEFERERSLFINQSENARESFAHFFAHLITDLIYYLILCMKSMF